MIPTSPLNPSPGLPEQSSFRRATSWHPVTPPRTGIVLRPATSHCVSGKRMRESQPCEEQDARRVKMYSKRDGAKLIKEYQHARDPSLIEVAPEQRCTRCMRNQWRCFIEADPHSPRRVCRPCGKNKCSFGNAKARPQVISLYAEKDQPKQESTHRLEPSHLPYPTVRWRTLPESTTLSPVSERNIDRDFEHQRYPQPTGYVQVRVDDRPPHRPFQSQSHCQSPPPPLLECPPSPSAHIYRRGSLATQSSIASPRSIHTPQDTPRPEWSRSHPPDEGMYEAKPPLSRDAVLTTIREIMATTRDVMGRLTELEAQILRQ